ncbi:MULTISPECIES: ABC transporter substrate-binding protein [unclassified Rhizobium]|uniref:ABC transporter substrate-binding protein n=1 Tax=unclassified Rhizobium TaxID=2613769 RepID=UPI0006FE6195|nr:MULTISPECIES: ABC transporter substrate-binding protein [unclassified Rhizobium]KQV33030.1 peptide ABC transporter substrate-binding protein [Rhizobium sp. Root1212]KRD27596.1 peptide ABC transporter substrate-binding protein [Rhizobium sp. Root268]
MLSLHHFRSTVFVIGLATALSGGFTVGSALAEDLRVGTQFKLMTLDPHYADLSETNSLLSHIYEHLVNQNQQMNAEPQLATSWERLSETRWEFKLRKGVKFHDGSAFTAQDVIYSIERIRDFLKPPSGGYQSYTQAIKSVTAPDPLTVVIETNGDVPTLPLLLTPIFIMPHKANGFATTDELNAGTLPIGTGPYKFESWQSGEGLNLTRNDAYWGGAPAWSKVSFRVIESPAARVAALTTGDVDIADYIPARDVEGVKQRGLRIDSTSAARANFLQFDIGREEPPGVTDKSGKPIANPFHNKRVRQALTMATDRAFIADKILLGYGTAAAQLFPPGLPGTSANLKVTPPDYEGAKALLAEAGFPDGFNVVLAGPAGRYPGDSESLQSIAQNWARIGVNAQPVVSPFSVFATQRSNGDFPVWYGGCSGEAVTFCLKALVGTPDAETGSGSLNYGKYHNPAFDEKLTKAMDMEDGPDRNAALAEATELVMADYPIVPLYHFHLIVGHGQKVGTYAVHPRGWTTAMQAAPAVK